MPEIAEITATDPMRREANHGLMVAWINRHQEYGCDVDKSVVLYDDDKLFEAALHVGAELTPRLSEALLEKTKVRYWSKGIV